MGKQPSQFNGPHRFRLDLIEFDENEQVVREIRKHPFGLLVIVLTGFILFGTTLVIGTFLSVWLEKSGSDYVAGSGNYSWMLMAISLLLAILIALLTGVYTFIYRSNTMLVTTDKIAQTLYSNIFSRKISQLSIGDVQDVTVTQNGPIAQLLNYGTIVIETAGEQQNYTFTYTPKPYESSKDIIAAHEKYVEKYGN